MLVLRRFMCVPSTFSTLRSYISTCLLSGTFFLILVYYAKYAHSNISVPKFEISVRPYMFVETEFICSIYVSSRNTASTFNIIINHVALSLSAPVFFCLGLILVRDNGFFGCHTISLLVQFHLLYCLILYNILNWLNIRQGYNLTQHHAIFFPKVSPAFITFSIASQFSSSSSMYLTLSLPKRGRRDTAIS